MLTFHLTCWFICYISYISISLLFNKQLKRIAKKEKLSIIKFIINEVKGLIYFALMAFIPILNAFIIFILIYAAFCSDETAREIRDSQTD